MASRSPWHHLYCTKAWHRLRWHQLQRHPLCRMHEDLGEVVRATIADHKIPHRGNEELFFDPENLQSLCKLCHDSVKQRIERRGYEFGCSEDGIPVDAGHHWNR